jgi:hypothetical protein
MNPTAKWLPRERLLTVCLCVLLACAWTLFAGKDFAWDMLNHHLYLPFSLVSGRHVTDLFAAGPQSYQNPVGYLPFYALVISEQPAWVVGLALTVLVVAPTAWALHRIARLVVGDAADDQAWRWLAVGAAITTPVFLITLGSSTNDPLCTTLLLLALSVAIDPRPSLRASVLGGCAMGLAIAIKPTSAVFALPMAVLAISRLLARQWPLSRGLAGTVSAVGALALAGGFWAWWLWRDYGNPVFPLFNQVFRSPLAPDGVIAAIRFLPETGFDFLARPWLMAQYKRFVSAEAFVPDIRPGLGIACAALACLVAMLRRGGGRALQPGLCLRADVQIGLFVLLSYPLWMMSSGNSRYAAIWIMACALLLVRSAQWLSQGRRWVAMGVAVLVGLNLAAYIADGDHRLGLEQRWDSGAYLPMQIPERLRTQPFLHLSVGVQSYSALAPFIHRDGAMVNVSGQMSLPTSGPLGDRLQQRLKAWEGRTRFLLAPHVKLDGPKFAAAIKDENFAQSHRLGLGIDTRDCERIRVLRSATGNERDSVFYLLSCAAVRAPRPDPELDRRVAHDEQVFRLLEARCPRVFGPTPFVTEYGPDLTWRRYLNSDVRINVSPTDGVVLTHYRARNPVTLGSAQDVINNGGRDACLAWKRLEIE